MIDEAEGLDIDTQASMINLAFKPSANNREVWNNFHLSAIHSPGAAVLYAIYGHDDHLLLVSRDIRSSDLVSVLYPVWRLLRARKTLDSVRRLYC